MRSWLWIGLVGLGGCVIDHELGDSVGEDTSSADAGSATGGPIGASEGDGGVSLSSTSAQPGDGSTSSPLPGEGTDPGPTGFDGTDDGMPDDCPLEPDPVWFLWKNLALDAPREASQSLALAGQCAMQSEIESRKDDPPQSTLRLSLDCTLEGTIDGEPVGALPHALEIEMYAVDLDPAALPIASAQDVRLRVASEQWFEGWDTWFVITRPDGTILLDVVRGSFTDPTDSGVGVAVAALPGASPWHGDLVVNAAPTECDAMDAVCGGEPRAIELGWDAQAQTLVEVGQLGTVHTDIEETSYRAHVRAAHVYTRPLCSDLPAADFSVVVWAEEP